MRGGVAFLHGFCRKRCAERGFLCGKGYMFVVVCGQREDTFPAACFYAGFGDLFSAVRALGSLRSPRNAGFLAALRMTTKANAIAKAGPFGMTSKKGKTALFVAEGFHGFYARGAHGGDPAGD